MDGKKDKLLWNEVQKESKKLLDGWKLRNKQSPVSASSALADNIDEKTFLNEQVPKELSSILQHWHTHHSLDNNQKDTFKKYIDYLSNFSKTNNEAAAWLNEQATLIDSTKKCADDIASNGYYLDIKGTEDPNLESYDSLIQVFTDLECDQLLDVIAQCVSTRFYTDTLYQLGNINASTLTLTQQFLLVTCPDYILTCDRQKSYCEKLLQHLLPHYTELFSHFLPNIEKWTDTIVLCLLYPIRFILSDSSSFPLDQKLAIQEALIMILFKKSITDSNAEREHITLVHTVLRVLFQLVRSDPKLLSELKTQTVDDTKLLDILKQLSNDTRDERLQLSALELLSLLVPEEKFTESNDAAKATGLIVKNFTEAVEKGKDSTANEILEGLIGLVHSDEVKQQAVEQNLLPSIMQFTKETTDDPAALKVAYALSFNPDAKDAFCKDKDFIDHVKEMTLSDNIEVTRAAHGVMWKLEDEEKFMKEADEKKANEQTSQENKLEEKEKSDEKKADEKQSQEKKSDVKEKPDEKKKDEELSKEKKEEEGNKDEPEQYDMMISYCWAQKELCHKINDRLEKDGYSVWLDRDEMHGSIVEAMATAVENSKLVLICMSNDYKSSVNCQAEAEYAFNRKSKMIPLMVEKDYKPEGWLGFMAGSKLYIDFADKEDEEFDKAYELLIAELEREESESNPDDKKKDTESDSAAKTETEPVPVPEATEPPAIQTQEYLSTGPATMWDKNHVNEFLTDNELDPLLPICKSMDGETLLEFYEVCKTMPLDTYRLLNKKDDQVPLDIFFKFIAKFKAYLPPPKPPQKIAFQCSFVYPPSTMNT